MRKSKRDNDRSAGVAGRMHKGASASAGWLLAAAVALFVGRPFVPGVAIAQEGYGAVFVVLWLLLLLAWLGGRIKAATMPMRFGWIDAVVLAFFVLYALSGMVAAVRASPRPAINVTWHWISLAIAYFLFRQLLQADLTRRMVVAVLIGLASAMAALGLEQALVSLPQARAVYERYKDNPQELYAQTGQWLPAGSSERRQFEARLRTAEPTATFALANSLAGLLVPGIVLAAGILAGQFRGGGSDRLWTLWLAIPLTALIGCLLYTHSRSGVAATAFTLGLVFVLRSRHRVWWTAGGLAIAACIGTTLSVLRPGVLADAVRSLAFRSEYWKATWSIIRDFPLLGCGPGQFQDTYTAYKLPAASEEVADPHNFLLEIWSTGGTPAATVCAAAILAILWRGRRFVVIRGHETAEQHEPAGASGPLRSVYLGAVGGVLLGAAAAWMDRIPLPTSQIALFAAVFAVTLAILHRWTAVGRLPWWLPAAAACGLLLHLCLSGGIGEPALAGVLWLLLVCVLNGSELERATQESRTTELADASLGSQRDVRQSREASIPAVDHGGVRWRALAGLVLFAGLLIAAYATYYRPVLSASAYLARADAAAVAGQDAARRQVLERAAEADPWSIEAARRLAALHFATWQEAASATEPAAWQSADARLRRLAPRRHSIWRDSAERYAALHAQSGDDRALPQAIRMAERAIALYPTYADHHLFHAELLVRAGRRGEARRAVAMASSLDEAKAAAGHADRTLPPDRRRTLDELALLLGP